MDKDSSKVLQIENLNIETGTTKLLHNVSLEVNRGEILGLVGESGSGKTITSLSIMQLLDMNILKTKGIIHLQGCEENIVQADEKKLNDLRGNHVSMIFQEPMTALNPLMRCGTQVAEVIHRHRDISRTETRKLVLDLFHQVQLPEPEKKYNSYPHELSGGQKQRVMIAMALANKPSLIIADEPTTALDVTVQAAILNLMKSLMLNQSAGMLFISHDLAVVSMLCDRIAVMYRGNIIEQGKTRQVLDSPQHPYTRALLACRPAAHERGKRLPVVSDFIKDAHETASVSPSTINLETNDSQLLLDVKDMYKAYTKHGFWQRKKQKTFVALNNVSFQIKKGETLGLVGESGCGKTTLSRCLLMLLPPDSGSIQYNGAEVTTLSREDIRKWRKNVQVIFQDPYSALNPRIPIGRAISEVMLYHQLVSSYAASVSRVIDLLQQVGLKAEHYWRYPHEFSGGQRQRICIARALSVEPEFIVCDESVSALDVSVQAQILNLLNDLKKSYGLSYLFISHDLSVVRYMSDRIMVMQEGRIIEQAESDVLFHQPQRSYTKTLLEAIPKLHYEN